MDNCPSCERTFEGILDFPAVEIIQIIRHPVSTKVVFPYTDSASYLHPDSRYGGQRVPHDVFEAFQTKGDREGPLEIGEWTWRRNCGGVISNSRYMRSQANQRKRIWTTLKVYLSHLKDEIGCSLSHEALQYDFTPHHYARTAFMISETGYAMQFLEQERDELGSRVTELHVVTREIIPGTLTNPRLEQLAKIATIKYNGLIREPK